MVVWTGIFTLLKTTARLVLCSVQAHGTSLILLGLIKNVGTINLEIYIVKISVTVTQEHKLFVNDTIFNNTYLKHIKGCNFSRHLEITNSLTPEIKKCFLFSCMEGGRKIK